MVVDRRGPRAMSEEEVDRLFHALADATRRDIVRAALDGEQSVSALARRYPMSVTAVQKHVAVLEEAHLVTKHRQGREQLVRGELDMIRYAHILLDQFEAIWRDRMDRFAHVLSEDALSENEGTNE